jgi:DNA primase
VLLAFDADEAGDRASEGIKMRIASFGARCERLAPEGAKDWNEMLLLSGRDYLSDWLTERVLFGGE